SVLSDTFSLHEYKWSPSEIHKHVVPRSLLCDQPSNICRAAGSSTCADAKADRKNTTKRKDPHRPGLRRRMERRSQRKSGSWRRIFLLANSLDASIEGRDHGETSGVSNCRSRRRLRRGKRIRARNCPVAQEKRAGFRQGGPSAHGHRQPDKKRNCLLDGRSRESEFEDLSWRSRAPRVVQANTGNSCAAMKNHCALLAPPRGLDCFFVERG